MFLLDNLVQMLLQISEVKKNEGRFEINFSNKKRIGWDDNVGRLSFDDQVIPDNDYYQNLSYTIKSPIEWRELRTPVNSLVHTAVVLKTLLILEYLQLQQLELEVHQHLQ